MKQTNERKTYVTTINGTDLFADVSEVRAEFLNKIVQAAMGRGIENFRILSRAEVRSALNEGKK